MQKIIDIQGGIIRNPLFRMAAPIDFQLQQGEQIAIVGNNGSGKTRLVDVLIGKCALMPMNEVKYDFAPSKAKMVSDNIKYLSFRDSYGTNEGVYYYQQRWNQNDIDETPLVSDLLAESFRLAEEGLKRKTVYDKFLVREETPEQEAARVAEEEADRKAMHAELEKVRSRLYDIFHLDRLLDKHIILLSSGELRKFQLTKTLLTNPRVLIMDNPFIGLDVEARKQLNDFLTLLVKETNVAVVLVLSKTDDIPEFITHVVPVKDMAVQPKMTLGEYRQSCPPVPARLLSEEKAKAILSLPYGEEPDEAETGTRQVIDFRKVNIRYGNRTILKDLSFTVMNGEHWALSGENGVFESRAVLFRTDQEEPLTEVSLGGQLILELRFLDPDTVCAIGEKSAISFTLEGELLGEYDYGDTYLRDYAISRDGLVVLALNPYQVGSRYSLVTLDRSGTALAERYVGEEILSLSAAGDRCAILTPASLMIYDKTLTLCASTGELDDASAVVLLDDGSAILLGGGTGRFYLPS